MVYVTDDDETLVPIPYGITGPNTVFTLWAEKSINADHIKFTTPWMTGPLMQHYGFIYFNV